MANYDKWSKGAAGHMCKHFERAKDEHGEYVKFGNRDIDPSRSHLNYNLAPKRKSQYGFIVDRCKELNCLNRKDVNVLASWIVTAPTTLPDEKLPEFFKATYKKLAKNYGEDNVVSAYVHMDESGRPHMHFAFIPVVWDKKKEAWKVSAKQCVTRTDLQNFHPWLESELQKELGYHVDIINEATKDGNKTVTELKRERELAKQAELAKATEEASERLEQKLRDIGKIEERLNAIKAPESVQSIKGKVSLTGRWVKVRKDEYELLKEHAEQSATVMQSARAMSADAQSWKERCQTAEKRYDKASSELNDYRLGIKQPEIEQEHTAMKEFLQQLNLLERFQTWFKEWQQKREQERSQKKNKAHFRSR